MKNSFKQDNYSYWIFDLDNTLYPEDDNIFSQVKMKIIKFISLELKIFQE